MSTGQNAVIKRGASLKECSSSKAHKRSAKEPVKRKRGGHELGAIKARQRSAKRHEALA